MVISVRVGGAIRGGRGLGIGDLLLVFWLRRGCSQVGESPLDGNWDWGRGG